MAKGGQDPIERGRQKWLFHVEHIGRKAPDMVSNFVASSTASGIPVGPQTRAAYERGTRQYGVGSPDHDPKPTSDSDRWKRNYLRAMAR